MSDSSSPSVKAFRTDFAFLKDLKERQGEELGVTDWMLLTQDRIDAFANATDDHQWIHVNPEMARQFSPFKSTIAHGFLVLSLAPRICYDTFAIGDIGMGLNYGLDKVRFPRPAPVGSLLRGRVQLVHFKNIPGGARFKVRVTMEAKGQDKPVCVADLISIAYLDPQHQNGEAQDLNRQTPPAGKNGEQTVLYEQTSNIAVITLNRPARYNAVNPALIEALRDALRAARRDSRVRAVVLRGAGKGFCAGADLEVFQGAHTPEELREYIVANYQPLMRHFLTLRKPIVGALTGSAAGMGAALALACDLRVMGENSSLLYAFSNIGLGPDGGASWLLARQVGYSRAFQIAAEGKPVSAQHCLELGLTNKVVPDEQVVEAAVEWAGLLAARPTLALGITKADLHYSMNHDLYDTITFEAEQQVAAFNSHDLREGVLAHQQQRKPRFIGK